MSRGAMRWAYGPKVLGLKLSASELAILRAICWSVHPKNKRTKPLTHKALARLTQVTSATTQNKAIERLEGLGLLRHSRTNQLSRGEGKAAVESGACVYSIPNSHLKRDIDLKDF